MKNNGSASAWLAPLYVNRCLSVLMPTTVATTQRKRAGGRPSYGPRHAVITTVPITVRDAIDQLAADARIGRATAAADLTAFAIGRSDMARRLRSSAIAIPSSDLVQVAAHQPPNTTDWVQLGTQLPVELLPALDALVTETGVNRSRVVANLVTAMVTQRLANRMDVVWPAQRQERLDLII